MGHIHLDRLTRVDEKKADICTSCMFIFGYLKSPQNSRNCRFNFKFVTLAFCEVIVGKFDANFDRLKSVVSNEKKR